MSIKREYETKTHTVTEKVLVKETRYCDVCGKEIGKHKSYWHISTHEDWGNDTIDSFEYFDICSENCMREKFEEYLKDSNDCNGMFFNVESF